MTKPDNQAPDPKAIYLTRRKSDHATIEIGFASPPERFRTNPEMEVIEFRALSASEPARPSKEPGDDCTNRYGVDMEYFGRELHRLSESLEDRPAEELARYLRKLADIAAPPIPPAGPALTTPDAGEILQKTIKQLVADAINYGKNSVASGIPSQAEHYNKMMVAGNDDVQSFITTLTGRPAIPEAKPEAQAHAMDDGETLDPRYGNPLSVSISSTPRLVAVDGVDHWVDLDIWQAMGQMLHSSVEMKKKLRALTAPEAVQGAVDPAAIDAQWVVNRCTEGLSVGVGAVPYHKSLEIIRSQALACIAEVARIKAAIPDEK